MLDTWFLEDIQAGLQRADRFVIIDEQRQCGPLLDAVRKRLPGTVFDVGSDVEELQVKYQIEKHHQHQPVVIVATIPLDDLKFLREYCETGGRLHIAYLHRYILHTVNQRLNIDLGTRPVGDIRTLGLLSIGKKDDFWLRVAYDELFTVDDILSFLKNPPHHAKTFGPEGLRLFCEYWSKFTPDPLIGKPPQTIADEFSAALFENMLSANRFPLLEQIYHTWIDSKSYEKALFRYLEKYTEPYGIDLWNVPVDHPFAWIDERQLGDVIAHLREPDWIQEKLSRLQKRAEQSVVKVLGIPYWQDLVTLLSYDASHIPAIGSLNDAVTHYCTHLHKVDNAVRHLYTRFMTEKEIVTPLQDYYRSRIQPFLDAWFTHFPGQYQENQTGLLQRLLTEYEPPVAIIVGDAISYEIAEEIVRDIESGYHIDHQPAYAGYLGKRSQAGVDAYGESARDARRAPLDFERDGRQLLRQQPDDHPKSDFKRIGG